MSMTRNRQVELITMSKLLSEPSSAYERHLYFPLHLECYSMLEQGDVVYELRMGDWEGLAVVDNHLDQGGDIRMAYLYARKQDGFVVYSYYTAMCLRLFIKLKDKDLGLG